MWDLLEAYHKDFAKQVAVTTSQGQMTFAQLYEAGERLADALAAAGLAEGKTTALALPNGLAFVPALLALARLSLSVALISPRYSASELIAIADGGQIDALIATASHAKKLAEMLERSVTVALDLSWAGDALGLIMLAPDGSSTSHGRPASPADRPAILKFTSGSTGEPKGIALSADNVVAEARNLVETLALTADDRIFANVPLFHSYGFDLGVLTILFSGASLWLQDYFVPRRLFKDLARDQITVLLGTPDQYRRCLEEAPGLSEPLPSVRYLLSCTAPLLPETVIAFHERFAMPICQHYGSSETGAATNHVPAEVLRRPASVGLPLKNVDVRVVTPDGREGSDGEEGEIVVRSAAVARGYVMGSPPGPSPFRDGAFRTGDLGVRDKNGYVYVRGRLDRIINVRGLKVSPLEVSRILENHPSVREAAVFGVGDHAGDEEVAAAVALCQATTESELIAYCYSQLADYKVPRKVVIVDALPRSPSGKIRVRPEDVGL